MTEGWIKLHRKLLDNPIAKKHQWLALWVTLLLLANHNNRNKFIWLGKEVEQKAGEFITGRKALKEQTGIPETTIERILDYLVSSGQIGQQKTTKYRLITILKWNEYQKVDNKRTTNGQQTDTIKNLKNDKNVKKEDSGVPPQDITEVISSFKGVNPSYGKWFNNPPQRSAIERMLVVHGKDRLLKVIPFLVKSNVMPYFPTITTPIQLEDKWATLESKWKQWQSEKEKKPSVVFSS